VTKTGRQPAGVRHHRLLGSKRLALADTGCRRSADLAGRRQWRSRTAVGIYSAIVTALYRRERTGKGSYVTTSLLAEGVWACGVSVQAALCNASFYPLHDRKNPPSMLMNVYARLG